MRLLSAAAVLLSLLPLRAAADDVLTLVNGDRVSGRLVGAATRRVRLQTPYGLLIVPREAIRRIERGDGSAEVVNAPPAAPEPPPPPAPEPMRLHVVVSGDSFWQAWDPKAPPSDPSLRLELRLEDLALASYTDATLDPKDLPKAVVNSFVFSPDQLAISVAPGVVASAPVVVAGEVGLPLKLPAAAAGVHRLRLVYQVNDGTSSAPRWRDVVAAAAEVTLKAGGTALVRVRQGRGAMTYAHHGTQNVETFTAALNAETAPAAPAAAP